jgi:hypothetical protein
MNRFVWDLRYSPVAAAGGGQGEGGQPARGPQVLPGNYQVRLTVAGQRYTQPLKVTLDPRSTATPIDLAKQFDLARKASREQERTAEASREIAALRRQLAGLQKKVSEIASASALLPQILALDADSARIAGSGGGRNADAPSSGLNAIRAELNAVANVVDSSDRTPPGQAYALFNQASRALATQLASWTSLKSGRLAELSRALRDQGLPEIDLQDSRSNPN